MAGITKIKILLADEHDILCEGLEALFKQHTDMKVVGRANNEEEVVRRNRQLKPHVTVIGLNIHGTNAIELCNNVHKANPGTKIIILSAYLHRHIMHQAMAVGVLGFVLKECDFDELVVAIRDVVKGQTHVCSQLMKSLAISYINQLQSDYQPAPPVLSTRECEIVRLVCRGTTTKQIAMEMGLSSKTIDACRRQVLQRLGIQSVAELVKYALRQGLAFLDD